MKRFLLISNLYPPHIRGGYELGCQAVARELAARNHEVLVATSKTMPGLHNYPSEHLVSVRPIFDYLPFYEEGFSSSLSPDASILEERAMAFSGYHPGNSAALESLLREFKPDVIWLFNPLGLGVLGILETSLSSPARFVWHLMDDMDAYVAGHQEQCYLLGRYRALKHRIHAIACSDKIAQAHARIGTFARLQIIPNGVTPPHPAISPARRRVPGAPFRFAYFGQINPEKGVTHLIHSFQLAQKSQPGLELHFYGPVNGGYREDFEKALRTPGLFHHGLMPRDRLLSGLHQYDAGVFLLNESEPFPYAPIESVFYGLPSIVTRKAFSLFPDDNLLVLPDREDHPAVARLLQWCATEPEKLRACYEQQWQSLIGTCSFQKVLGEYLSFIEATPSGPSFRSASPAAASFLIRSLYPRSTAMMPARLRAGSGARRSKSLFPWKKIQNLLQVGWPLVLNIFTKGRPLQVTLRKQG